MGLIQWAITEISHPKQGNKLRERFNAAVVIVFGELLLRVFAEVIGVIKSQAAVVFLKGVNLWFFRLSDGWRGRSGQPFLPAGLQRGISISWQQCFHRATHGVGAAAKGLSQS